MAAAPTHAHASRLRGLVLPARFGDAETTTRAHILYGLALASAATSLIGNVVNYALAAAGPRWLLLLLMQLAIALTTLILIQSRHVTTAAWFLIGASWAGNVLAAWTVGGLAAPSILAQLVVILAAGLLFGWRSTLAAATAAVGVIIVMAWAGNAGALPQPAVTHNPWSRATVIAAYIVLAAVMVAIAVWNKRRGDQQALQQIEERIAAEATLAESRAVLSAVVESTTDAVFIKDRDDRYLFINSAGAEILQTDAADVVGKDDYAFFPREQAAALRADDARVMATGDTFTEEQNIAPGGGALRWQLITKGPLRADDGTIRGLYGMARDISERRQDEERLRATLDSLLDAHTVLQAIRAADGRIVDFVHLDANEAAAAYLRLDRDQIVGARFLELVPQRNAAHMLPFWIDVVETGRPLVLDDYRMVSSAGSERRFDMRGVRVGDGLSFTWRDVTGRHEMEASLRRRVEELDALQRISRLAAQSDLPVALTQASAEIAALFDARSARLRLLPAQDEDEDEGLTEEITAAAAAGGAAAAADPAEEAVVRETLEGRRPLTQDGSQGTTPHLLSVPLVAESAAIGVLTVTRDGSTAPFGERELRVAQPVADALAAAIANERLHRQETRRAAQDERRRLARDLHDAVTQSIYAASLIARSLPAIWEQSPEEGLVHLTSLRRLVRAALAELRTLLYELRPATLEETPLETLLARLGEALEGHVDVVVEIATTPDLNLPRDVKLVFYRVAQEALSNVGKHAQASTVRVDVTGDQTTARLTVRDDGKGFVAAGIRPDSMGLRIMRERADEVGAAIAVDSAPGQGTAVTIAWARPDAGAHPPASFNPAAG